MPALADYQEDLGLNNEDKGALKDKLILLVIVIILFHIAAFVSVT